jgi:hypothetical protein
LVSWGEFRFNTGKSSLSLLFNKSILNADGSAAVVGVGVGVGVDIAGGVFNLKKKDNAKICHKIL